MTVKQVFNTSAELDYPTVLPTLDLDFANTKTLDPRITFTRASGGSYVGADGLIKYAGVNEARFDHDPETGESLGLLIEEARTNLLLRSEEFNLWAITRSTIQSNAITAPDGTNTADKLVEDTTPNNNHIVFRGPLGLSSNVYTFSVYVKAAERNEIVLRIDTNVAQRNVRFNLVEGTIVSVGAVSARIEYVGNGWYRCINTMNIAEEVINAVLMLADSRFPVAVYPGDGSSGIYIWGAQIEAGSFPTSYIPTQASTRTRAADSVQIVGKNFTNFFNKNEGTTLITYRPRFDGSYQSSFAGLFIITDNISGARSIGLVGNSNAFQLYFVGSSGAPGAALLPNFTWLAPPTPSSKRTERAIISYGNDYIRMYQNSIPFTSTSPTYGLGKIEDIFKTQVNPNTVNYVRLYFGGDPAFTGRFNCTIQNFRYYPKDLGPQLLKNISQIYP
jgi:hypothetical protein